MAIPQNPKIVSEISGGILTLPLILWILSPHGIWVSLSELSGKSIRVRVPESASGQIILLEHFEDGRARRGEKTHNLEKPSYRAKNKYL